MTIQKYNIEKVRIPYNDKEVILTDSKNREICVNESDLINLEDMR